MKKQYTNRSGSRMALGCLLVGMLGSVALCAEKVTPLLSDGLMLPDADGTVTQDTNEGTWHFTLRSDRLIGKIRIGAGTSYELLPGQALAALAADVEKRSSAAYRLWARVTHYRGRNYLYLTPSYFFPLADKTPPSGVAPPDVPRDPNQGDTVGIPADVLAMMEEQQAIASGPEGAGVVIPEDELLLGRRGILQSEGERVFFVLDGLGQNVSQSRFLLLPSATRERMERQQDQHADQFDFRVSGVWTQYQGQACLLLHQAVRLYGYGNFD